MNPDGPLSINSPVNEEWLAAAIPLEKESECLIRPVLKMRVPVNCYLYRTDCPVFKKYLILLEKMKKPNFLGLAQRIGLYSI